MPEPAGHYHEVMVASLAELLGGELPPGTALVFHAHRPRPLAIGSTKALLAHHELVGPQAKELKRIIARWCRTKLYLRALTKRGAHRHDVISGEPVEPVSEEHRAGAVAALKVRDARLIELRKAERQAAKVAADLELEMLEAAEKDPLRARAQQLAAAKTPWRAISQQLGISVETVKAWLAPPADPPDARMPIAATTGPVGARRAAGAGARARPASSRTARRGQPAEAEARPKPAGTRNGGAAVSNKVLLLGAVLGLFLFAHRLPPFERRDCNPTGVSSLIYHKCPPPTRLVAAAFKTITGVELPH